MAAIDGVEFSGGKSLHPMYICAVALLRHLSAMNVQWLKKEQR